MNPATLNLQECQCRKCAGCGPHLWIKLIVGAIASAYLGGEGVISLPVADLTICTRSSVSSMKPNAVGQ